MCLTGTFGRWRARKRRYNADMAGNGTVGTKASARQRATTERRTISEHVPSRQQYFDLKRQHPDAILLFRLGDFYETFDEDAKIVARDARITLTTKNFGRSGRVPMAGIPYHALNHYLGRLLAAGHTLAIAEQLSEPGRGLVDRAITRVLSPGTVEKRRCCQPLRTATSPPCCRATDDPESPGLTSAPASS